MINIENLIKSWEIFRDSNPYQICDGKEFRAIKEPEYCMGQMITDTLKLLEERKPIKPEKAYSGGGATWWNVCGSCKTAINPNDKFCHECGKPIEWNRDGEEVIPSMQEKQEAFNPEWNRGMPFCGNCGRKLEKKSRGLTSYCPYCKKEVNWE